MVIFDTFCSEGRVGGDGLVHKHGAGASKAKDVKCVNPMGKRWLLSIWT